MKNCKFSILHKHPEKRSCRGDGGEKMYLSFQINPRCQTPSKFVNTRCNSGTPKMYDQKTTPFP